MLTGSLIGDYIKGIVLLIFLIMIVFELVASLIPDAQDSGDTACSAGIPFASLFKGSGILLKLAVIGIILILLDVVLGGLNK